MQFRDVIGHEELKKKLVGLVKQNRISHALLFLGREGVGALPLALAFAQYIVCERVNGKTTNQATPSLFGDPETEDDGDEVSVPNDSCGVCPACVKSSKLAHPDIHFSYPVVTRKSGEPPLSSDYIQEWREFIAQKPYTNEYEWLQFIKAENKQGNITVKECHEILHKLNLKSYESEYKILIMWKPEALGKYGNTLLKMIEEPPPKSLMIFVAENEDLMLPTIISRTQLVKVPRLREAELVEGLIEKHRLEKEKAHHIAMLSNGSFFEAENLLQHDGESWEYVLKQWLNAIIKTGPADELAWVENMAKNGREKQKHFLRYFSNILEMAIFIRVVGKEKMPGYSISGDEFRQHAAIDFAEKFNKFASVEGIEAIKKEIDNAIYYIERNANAKMLFHALTIKLYHIIKNNSVILIQ